MIDINFYMAFDGYTKGLQENKEYSVEEIFKELESIRSKTPVIYNIETTNRCNMKCEMCPRTTMMTRKNEDIERDTFLRIVEQIRPHTDEEWKKWVEFCESRYGVYSNDMSENHFFLYIIPKVIQLHGYGDPLLDKNIGEYIRILNRKGFSSYFSCNPANINLEKTYEMLNNGLDYIKYSIESVDDEQHKRIRGDASNFSDSYKQIKKVIDYKKKNHLPATIVITMLDLNRKSQKDDFDKLKEAFHDLDVYLYLKSEDCQWYRKDFHGTESIHWSEICKHPWMSMTVKSNGEAAMCMEDFNNEIVLGDTSTSTLKDIWNNERYKNFRLKHLTLSGDIKCIKQCDMALFGNCYKLRNNLIYKEGKGE